MRQLPFILLLLASCSAHSLRLREPSFPAPSAYAPVAYSIEEYDDGDLHAAGEPIVIRNAGDYIVGCDFCFQPVMALGSGFRYIVLELNAIKVLSVSAADHVASGGSTCLNTSTVCRLEAGDEVACGVQQNSGAVIYGNSRFWLRRLK